MNRNPWWPAALLLIVLALVAGMPAAMADAASDAESGKRALDSKEYDLAIHYLTRAIQAGTLDDQDLARVYYHRGRAYTGKFESKSALSDFDLAIRLDNGATDVTGNAEYSAGGAAYQISGNYSQSSRYWQSCAGRGHCGCMNIAAHGKLSGGKGFTQDVPGAAAMHRAVVDTGTQCKFAGAYSAEELAIYELFGVTGPRNPNQSLQWLDRADRLLDEIQQKYSDEGTQTGVAGLRNYLWLDHFLVATHLNWPSALKARYPLEDLDLDAWPGAIVRIYLGKATREDIEPAIHQMSDDMQNAPADRTQRVVNSRECTADFLDAALAAAQGLKSKAVEQFKAVLEYKTGCETSKVIARAELDRLNGQ
jgi:tetratricopeptide (TPR) repeat protein